MAYSSSTRNHHHAWPHQQGQKLVGSFVQLWCEGLRSLIGNLRLHPKATAADLMPFQGQAGVQAEVPSLPQPFAEENSRKVRERREGRKKNEIVPFPPIIS
jgi:hypothetical protein